MAELFDEIKKQARRAAFEADKKKRIFQIRSEIGPLQREIERKTREIGVAVLQLFDAGRLNQDELVELCREVARLREQIAEKEAEIRRIEEEKFPEAPTPALYGHICPKCKVQLPNEVVFCPRCGTKTVYVSPPLGRVCPNCGLSLPEGTMFCPRCGTRLGA